MMRRNVILTLMTLVIVVLSFTQAIDGIGSRNTEDALVRALATFGIARALNGVISVAQGTEVAIEPAGVGVILTPGQILDPVNDLVERFSWVMLVSSASLGVLNVLQAMSAWVGLSILVTVVLIVVLYLIWHPSHVSSYWRVVLVRMALLLLMLRFVAPVIAIANDLIYQQFLDPRYLVAITELQQTTERMSVINEESKSPELRHNTQGLLDKAKALYESTANSIKHAVDIQSRMQRYEAAASDVSRHTVDLIVVFILQTILLPIFFLWIAWQLFRRVAVGKIPARYDLIQGENHSVS